MGQLSIEIPHTVGKEELIRRVKAEVEKARPSVPSLHDEWQDNVLKAQGEAMGMKVSGTLEVEDNLARIKLDLPFAAMMFKGAIEKRIREEARGLLT